jgi:hypothetical protein
MCLSMFVNIKDHWESIKGLTSNAFTKLQQANKGGSYLNSKELLSGPPQPLYQTQQRSHAQISSPRWVQKGARVPNRCWHPSSSIKLTVRVITASSSSHLSSKQGQAIQINEIHKSQVTGTLAHDPEDHCKHQQMLEQAPTHTRTSLCDTHTS